MLQVRPQNTEGGVEVFYNPSRDIVYLYENAVRKAMRVLQEGLWPDLAAWLAAQRISQEDLGKTVQTFCMALEEAKRPDSRDFVKVLQTTGFLDCPEPARVALLCMIGSVMAGTFFHGIRETSGPQTHERQPRMRSLLAAGDGFLRFCRLPWWQRWLLRWWWRWSPREIAYKLGDHDC